MEKVGHKWVKQTYFLSFKVDSTCLNRLSSLNASSNCCKWSGFANFDGSSPDELPVEITFPNESLLMEAWDVEGNLMSMAKW